MSTVVSHSDQLPRIEDITDIACGHPEWRHHERVLRVTDAASGLNAIIAIHDTTLGPALGGTRVWPYRNEDEALTDVLRLSQGMTLKAALAGTPTGGGKGVIIADPRTGKSPDLLRAYGRAVDSLGGGFVTGEDVGLTVADADTIAEETSHIVGSSARGGDPAPATALGVYLGIKSALRHRLGNDSLRNRHVAVQGLGNVGRNLVELLHRDGASFSVADINAAAVAEAETRYGATGASTDGIYDVEADVFAPCALGGVLSDETIPRMKFAVVAGSANNQLAEDRHGEMLARAGILYAPDYVINGGGLIALSLEYSGGGYTWPKARGMVAGIGKTLDEIFARASAENRRPETIAAGIAAERLAAASRHLAAE